MPEPTTPDDAAFQRGDPSSASLIGVWQELGFPRLDRPVGQVDLWIVVLEVTAGGGTRRYDIAALEDLIEALGHWEPSALFNEERYALQMHVSARSAAEALGAALAEHYVAATGIGLGGLQLLRAEVLSRDEFEHSCQDQLDSTLAPASDKNRTAVPGEVYQATRKVLAAATAGQVADALMSFVVAIGATVTVGQPPTGGDTVSAAVPLGHRPDVYATADAMSMAGLMVEQWLPVVIEDATRMLLRLTASAAAAHPATDDPQA